jgi:predicted nucleotide-binding protein
MPAREAGSIPACAPRPYASSLQIFTGINAKITRLESLSDRLELLPEPQAITASAEELPRLKPTDSRKIFVVHGRDEAAKQAVARFLSTLDLDPIILHEQPSRGDTIIEKFETNSEAVAFAVILVTPDDEGRLHGDPELRPRARQNVVWEWGYFVGKFGRKHVCALYTPGTELPSDLHGLVWIEMDTAGAWRLRLAMEFSAAAIEVDLNKLAVRW